jgi:hypothetical protein
MQKRCPFCHQDISVVLFDAHVAEHTRLREDGQMTDHVTVAPEERFQGDLAGVPQWYRHQKCGAVTGMPEEIIRSYLADPFLYNDSTFCTGCGNYPHQSEFVWVETGENLHAYNRRLRLEYVQRNRLDPNGFVWKDGFPERRKRKVGGLIAVAGCLAAVVVLGGLLIVAAAAAVAILRRPAPAPPAFAPPAPPAFANDPAFPGPGFDAQRDMQRQMDEMRRQHEEMIKSLRQ